MSASEIVGRAAKAVATAGLDPAEAAGLLAAVASVGPSFDRGLLPRPLVFQAGLTGVVSALNYGLTVTSQSALQGFANRVTGGRAADRRAAILAADALAFGAGLAVQAALPQRPGEPLVRATGRALAWRLSLGAMCGGIGTAVDAAADQIRRNPSPDRSGVWMTVGAGTGVAAALHLLQRRKAIAEGADEDATGVPMATEDLATSTRRAVVIGAAISTGIYLLSRTESMLANGVGQVVGWAVPPLAPAQRALGHAAVLGAAGFAGYRGLGQVYRSTEQAGAAIEPAYAIVPTNPSVSGGPGSLVDWNTFGREGRRYVNMALTAADITAVTGAPAIDPIRAYSGLTSAPTPGERAELAMDELERLGAFDRKVLAVFSPTGTGYVNYVAAETLEYLTGGDCASVAVQYSVRPSFLSLDRVKTAWEGTLSLLTALSWKLRSLPADQRPRLLLFGESLGSQSAQDVFLKQGTRGFARMGIDRSLFIGTPFASRWREAWLDDPAGQDPDGHVVQVASIDEWRALPTDQRNQARIVLLTHHTDPIPKFGLPLAVQAPRWLGPRETREPGIPPEMHWRPMVTFFSTLVDVLNADNVRPGTFESFGHDYRADLAELVRVAFDLPTDDATMARIEAALRQRELQWATRRLVTAKAEDAEAALRKQLDGWGVDQGSIPQLLASASKAPADPYAAG